MSSKLSQPDNASAPKDREPPAPLQPDLLDLGDVMGYEAWRDAKLNARATSADDLLAVVQDLGKPTDAEQNTILTKLRTNNMVVYSTAPSSEEGAVRQSLASLTKSFGLFPSEAHRSAEDDGFVSLEVVNEGSRAGYIPYTTKPLSWHTDGYYNSRDSQIRAFVLHCLRDASSGGENGLLDPEIAYIRLRDLDPVHIEALMHDEAMTIPSNTEKDGSIRPASVGPVFSRDPASGALVMRYTARARNIVWRDTPETKAAAATLLELLKEGADVIRHRMQPGQGLICNNVLHNRTSFVDKSEPGEGRLYLRARFDQRIAGT